MTSPGSPSFAASDPARLRLGPHRVTRRILEILLRPIPAGPGVLLISRGDLFPPNHGAAVKIDRTAAALSRLTGPVCLVTDHRDRFYRYRDGERVSVRYPLWLSLVGPWRWRLRRGLRAAGIPAEETSLYGALRDWSLDLRAAYVAARYGMRVFQAEFPAYARVCLWVRSLRGGLTILVEHNVEFERLREQFDQLTAEGYAFLRQTEIFLCNQVDRVVAVSERDRECLVRQGVDATRVHVIPHGVDLAAFDAAAGLPHTLLRQWGVASGRPLLVYHGTYRYPPNLEAMRILADEILPRLRMRGLAPAVMAIGPSPPARDFHPDFVFVGGVDSVAPYIKAGKVAVVPLQRGGGTRMKILDYFAAAVPVVSTSKGVEGLGLVDGRQVLIRDGFDDFSDAVADLLCDRVKSRALGAAGRRYVEQLDWLKIARRYVDLFALCRGERDCPARHIRGGEEGPAA